MSNIYHFTKLKTGIENILPHMTLKANNFHKTNDPRETFLWSFSGTNIRNDHYDEDQIEASFRIGYESRKNARVICFTNESSGAKNEMMWSHYGETHEGLCLELDREVFIKENEEVLDQKLNFFENVNYMLKEEYIKKPLFYNTSKDWNDSLDSFIQSNYPYLYFTKSHFWEKEDEHRLVVIDKNWDGLLSIKKSLKSVIIGIYCYEKYIATIEKLIGDDVKIKQCIFQIDTPRIEIEERPKGDYREDILKKYLKKFHY